MAKTIIAPLLAFIYLTLEIVFGIKIDEQLKLQIKDWIENGVMLGIILYGIIANHRKKKEAQK